MLDNNYIKIKSGNVTITTKNKLSKFMLLDELFYKYLLNFHFGIAYILVLKIYLNVQALFGLLLNQLHFVIDELQKNVLTRVVLFLLLYLLVLYRI